MILEQINRIRLRIASFEVKWFNISNFVCLINCISKQTWATLGIACFNCSCRSVACSSASFISQFRASVVSCTRSTRFRTFSEVPFTPLAICVYFESKWKNKMSLGMLIVQCMYKVLWPIFYSQMPDENINLRQSPKLQDFVCVGCPVQVPAATSTRSLMRFLSIVPAPHVVEHCPHALQLCHVQSRSVNDNGK